MCIRDRYIVAYNAFDEGNAGSVAPVGKNTVVLNAKTAEGIETLKQKLAEQVTNYEDVYKRQAKSP